MMDMISGSPGLAWLILAALLALAELVTPGIFLIFVAAGAAVVGVVTLLVPGFGIFLQLPLFAAATAVAVAIGRRWYRQYPVATADPLLNDRAARLVGQELRVTEAIKDGHGRVRVGDGEWPVAGDDAPVGAKVLVVAAEAGVLTVAPLRG